LKTNLLKKYIASIGNDKFGLIFIKLSLVKD